MLFEKQYILTQTVEVEVRYRTETRTDSEGNDYDVEVPYNYYICNVKLENFDLSHVPVYIMDEETLSLYAVYMATLGNREDLFPGSGYVDKYTKPPTTYDIPLSALEDETFAALITEAEKTAKNTAATAKSAAQKAKDAFKETFLYIKHHSRAVLLVIGIGACVALLFGGISSCSMMAGSGVGGVFTSSYLSEDADMLAAEAAYCELEQELQYELDHYEALHPGYDEYRFDLDEIEHDPYVLISILTAFHEGVFTIDEVQAELQMLFEKQYILTQTVEVEVRYRTETRTDSEGNDYDVEVPYNYYICKVKLENFDLSHVPVYIMDEETLSLYAVYMATLGNREDLFPGSGYVDKYTKPPTTYDIPPSALEDETFAALITEAEKYIGYPYVWGGSNPNTSFDCSGFVSWVLTQSGVCNTGRLGAQGLYNISTPVSSANARPGDLIFFVGTYDTPGVSHVGIYVGGGKMLHCGDPIQYADINTSYWQSHFYAFGRPPYN